MKVPTINDFVLFVKENDDVDPEDMGVELSFNVKAVYNNQYELGRKNGTLTYLTECTALHIAIAENKPLIVKWLIEEHGADQDSQCVFHEKKSNLYGNGGAHEHVSCTALGLAEKLGNDCLEVLKPTVQVLK